MKVLIELDELNKIRSAALDNDDRIEKLCAINAELTAQVSEKDRCIARLKDKLALHESSLQFIDGLVKDQAARIRKMMAGESLEAAKPDDDGWIEWAGGDRPVPKPVKVEVQYRRGTTEIELGGKLAWWHGGPTDWDIVAYRIVK